MIKEEEYQLAHMSESFGSHGDFGIKIFIATSRKLTEEDGNKVRRIADTIEETIRTETLRLDPQAIERAKKEREELLKCFGNEAIFVEEIPNGYCNQWCCKHLPWLVVTTRIGKITIGWRKRVINIDWKGSMQKKTGEMLFPDYKMTKGDDYIHVYGYEYATKFLGVIINE